MNTTSIVVELLVVGFLCFLSLVAVLAVAAGCDMEELMTLASRVELPFQLAAAYVAGIVWNRLCDQCFHHVDIKLIRSNGYATREAFQLARTKVIQTSDRLRDHLAYFRNLIRVTRATTVTAAVYCLLFPFAPLRVFPFIETERQGVIALILLDIALFAAGFAWYKLEDGYIASVRDSLHVINRPNDAMLTEGIA